MYSHLGFGGNPSFSGGYGDDNCTDDECAFWSLCLGILSTVAGVLLIVLKAIPTTAINSVYIQHTCTFDSYVVTASPEACYKRWEGYFNCSDLGMYALPVNMTTFTCDAGVMALGTQLSDAALRDLQAAYPTGITGPCFLNRCRCVAAASSCTGDLDSDAIRVDLLSTTFDFVMGIVFIVLPLFVFWPCTVMFLPACMSGCCRRRPSETPPDRRRRRSSRNNAFAARHDDGEFRDEISLQPLGSGEPFVRSNAADLEEA